MLSAAGLWRLRRRPRSLDVFAALAVNNVAMCHEFRLSYMAAHLGLHRTDRPRPRVRTGIFYEDGAGAAVVPLGKRLCRPLAAGLEGFAVVSVCRCARELLVSFVPDAR